MQNFMRALVVDGEGAEWGSFWVGESALGGQYSRGLGISLSPYPQFHKTTAEEFQYRDLNESFGSQASCWKSLCI